MSKKDKVVSWFMRNVLMGDREDFEKAGFITEKVEEKARRENIRDINLPEKILENIENEMVKRGEEKARERLYSVGKKFGYRYAGSMGIPKYKKGGSSISKKKFKTSLYFMVRYIASVSAKSMDYGVDFKRKKFTTEMEDFIVCRKNGLGYIFPTGVSAGLWMFGSDCSDIEGVQTQCQGRGDEKCKVVCAPREVLNDEGIDFFKSEINSEEVEISLKYGSMNKIREADYAENSLQNLIDMGFFEYEGGKISHNDDRYILTEISLIYLLEKELPAEKDVLFDSAFQYGKYLSKKESDRKMNKFIREYLSACGWGDTLIRKKNGKFRVEVQYFPWTKFWKDTSLPIYRGLVSGLLSGFEGEKIQLTEVEKDVMGKGFTVVAKEV